MHAQYDIADRMKRVRGLLKYTQSGIAKAIGSKMRSWQEWETGNRMPGGQAFAGLAKLGVNVNWILTGEGEPLLADAAGPGCTSDLPNSAQNRALTPDYAASAAYTINPKLLEDVLSELRAHQDNAGVRFKVVYEALLAVEIYQYILEEEGPTPEDRAKTRKLVRSIIWGMDNARAHTAEGDD